MIGFSQDGPFYFTHNNLQREFYLHIPNNLPSNSPVVYVFHGWGGNGGGIMSNTAFNILSDQNNFAVCYPTALIDGDNGTSGLTSWNCSGLSDVDFIHALNDSLQNQYQFDENRIFATGFSYGGDPVPKLSELVIDVSGSIYQEFRAIFLFLPHALRCWFVDTGSCLQLLHCEIDQVRQHVLHESVCANVQHCRRHEHVLVVYLLR